MKTMYQIYEGIKNKFFNKTGLDIQEGTVVDDIFIASSDAIYSAYAEIENNKNPHIFSSLTGEDLDAVGFSFNCIREENETDDEYRYRILNWLATFKSCNLQAINAALASLTYASSATYVPRTHGTGTATVYVIPSSYDNSGPELAIAEVKEKLKNVISPGSYVEYIVPEIRKIRFVIYIDTGLNGETLIKENLETKIKDYVNSVAVGENLEIGEINKIGINENGVEYFNVVQTYINDEQSSDIEFLQTLESKFIFDEIVWWAVNS